MNVANIIIYSPLFIGGGFGIWLAFYNRFHRLNTHEKIRQGGHSTTATVIAHVGLGRTWKELYEYEIDGITYEQKGGVDTKKHSFGMLEIGDKIEVYYDPKNPNYIVGEGLSEGTEAFVFYLCLSVGIIMCVAGLFFVVSG